jgi:hypothetical protein
MEEKEKGMEMTEATISQLWYLFIFAWGIASAWAVVSGFQKGA